MYRFLKRALSLTNRFSADRSGNVLITFAIAILPIFTLVGVIIDYGRASSLRSKMQATADATALMIAKDAPDLNASQIQSKANGYFLANFSNHEAAGVTVNTVYTPNTGKGSTILVKASATLPNQFAKFVGKDSTSVGTQSTATWATRLCGSPCHWMSLFQ